MAGVLGLLLHPFHVFLPTAWLACYPIRLLTFGTAEDARQVIDQLNGVLLEGRKIFLREDRSAIEQQEGVVVFVGNLPWSATSHSLAEAFAEFRPIDVHVKTNMAGKSRGTYVPKGWFGLRTLLTMWLLPSLNHTISFGEGRAREGTPRPIP